MALVIHDDGGPGIGGAHEGALKFQGTHARYLQMLVNGRAISKPAQVADIGK